MGSDKIDQPYPVVAISDLANHYSPEHLRFALENCRKVIAKLIAVDDRSDQQRARYRILRYVDLQLVRASEWADRESDLMAWVIRNLIELKFWANFVSESEANAARFLSEADIDASDLFKRLNKWKAATDEAWVELPTLTNPRISIKPSGEREELTWKSSSKLIHPSSFAINHFDETLGNSDLRQFFAIQTLMYGWGIVEIFHNIEWQQ